MPCRSPVSSFHARTYVLPSLVGLSPVIADSAGGAAMAQSTARPHSRERILVTHAGALPRPDELRALVLARSRGEAIDEAALEANLEAGVVAVVRRQAQCGVDIVNDGELSK